VPGAGPPQPRERQLRGLPGLEAALDGRTLESLSPQEVFTLVKAMPALGRKQGRHLYGEVMAEMLRTGRLERVKAHRELQELRQILNRSPSQIDALQLLTLIRLERGEAAAAETQVKGVYGGLIRPEPKAEALGVGLLLAELQQKRDEAPAAELTYQELALAFPEDQRPLIGLALLRHARGNGATQEFTFRRHHVDTDRRSEINHYRRRLELCIRGKAVHDPVGPDFLGIVHQ
jgi:hypothetical protein